jgi:uncharacterized membrane protein YbhN (UPF0104 family)
MEYIRRVFSGHQLESNGWELTGIVVLGAVLFLAAAAGMAYIAGFHSVWLVLKHPHWGWLVVAAAAEILSFAGYGVGYRGINKVERGPDLPPKALFGVVASGFGGFLAQGGGALDHYAMTAAGASAREASARVAALGGFEHGSLPWIVWPTAIALWIIGGTQPPKDFVTPWAVIPPIGFAIGIWAAERWRDELRGRPGWRGKLAVFFDGTHYVWVLFRHPVRCGAATLGMILFWGASMFSLWAAVAAFGLHMEAGTLIICYGTAYLATQRTAPLGGAGLLMCALVPTLWYVGKVPFAVAMVGVLAYRFLSLWLFMPVAFASLPILRALGRTAPGTPGERTAETHGEPALQH